MTICLGGNLKRLRKSKDMTQESLADFLGISADKESSESLAARLCVSG